MPRSLTSFHSFFGQKKVIAFLQRLLEGAQTRNEPFPHTIFLGPSGSGKSKLARALAAAYGTLNYNAMGYASRQDLAQKLCNLKPNDFLFIDEAHRLGGLEQEFLTEAIDNLTVPNLFPTDETEKSNENQLSLHPWSLILATDQPGHLLDALLKRMVVQVKLSFYSLTELKEIVEVIAGEENLLIGAQAAMWIAQMSTGLPRKARQLLHNLRLFHPDSESHRLGVTEVRAYLDAADIDQETGLGPLEQAYLIALNTRTRASLETLSLSLGTDTSYLKRQVEPLLVRQGLVEIGQGGRQLTPLGQQKVCQKNQYDTTRMLFKKGA